MPRLVLLADTHGQHSRLTGPFAVPDGDVLVFAGDACSVGTAGEWKSFCRWLGDLPHEHKIIVPGNHDWVMQYFEFAEARRIAKDYGAQPPRPDGETRAEYDHDLNLVRLYDPSAGDWDEYGPVDVDGHVLYPVGACYWTWEQEGTDGSRPHLA